MRSALLDLLRALDELGREGACPLDRAHALQRLCSSLCALHGFDIRQRGELPRGPCVLVCNHLGYIDPLVLCSLRPLAPIAKVELASWPIAGELLARCNVSFVRRGDAHSGAVALRRALRRLDAGVSVLNFPEGTTTRGRLLPFHRGAFWLARRAGVPLVPIAMRLADPSLCWVDEQSFLPHYCRLLSNKDKRVEVELLRALDPRDFSSDRELMAAAHAAIATRDPPPRLAAPLASPLPLRSAAG